MYVQKIKKPILPLDTSLEEVKSHLKANFSEGCECPACGQNVKLYERKITSAMAYGLILLIKSNKVGYFHIEDYLKGEDCPSSIRGDMSKLRYFGLIERQDSVREDGSSRAGFYKVTDKGRMFANNQVTVPEHVNIYNNIVYGYSENHIGIERALGSKFNYNELMKK